MDEFSDGKAIFERGPCCNHDCEEGRECPIRKLYLNLRLAADMVLEAHEENYGKLAHDISIADLRQAVKGKPFDRPPTIDHGPCPWDICTGDCQWDQKGENQCPYK